MVLSAVFGGETRKSELHLYEQLHEQAHKDRRNAPIGTISGMFLVIVSGVCGTLSTVGDAFR